MNRQHRLSRRTFIIQAGLSGVALAIGCSWPEKGKSVSEIVHADLAGTDLMSWISIDENGAITIYNHRSEMGQGTWQTIPQIIAEELEVNMDQVTVRYAAANPAKYGPQPSDGSFSVRGWWKQLLRVGASAREMLVAAAAAQWGVHTAECYAENGEVVHRPSGRKLGYGTLVKDAARLTPPQDVKLKERRDYKLIGRSLQRLDVPAKVNGSAVFGLDKKLPGMLYAVVERNPRFRGKVRRFDDEATRKITGVKHVLKVERPVFGFMCEGVAVVADSLWAAMEGRKVLKVEWNDEGFEHLDSESLYARMQQDLTKSTSPATIEAALTNAAATIEAVYETPYQSHSCMEPLNCIADVKDDRVEIWGPIQEANWIQAELSERLRLSADKVVVNMTFLGGGFGRKAFPDYPVEAALISKAIKSPVQVLWTREDDMTIGPFRGGALYRCRGAVNTQKKIAALQVILASQYMGAGQLKDTEPKQVTFKPGEYPGLVSDYYKSIPQFSFDHIPTTSPIPTMWWRAPGANINAFASECFIDELAQLAAEDPLVFRKKHLVSERYQALIDQLAAFSKWDSPIPGVGRGVAITECFGGIVGQVVKVSRAPDKKIKIDKVYAVIDCGWYVNPDIIRAQLEGSIVMALGAALNHATHFRDGKAVETNFHNYLMPRMHEIPEIAVHIMENDEPAGGVGEPGLPAFAPALCNAIFDLTGKRIRKLPFILSEV